MVTYSQSHIPSSSAYACHSTTGLSRAAWARPGAPAGLRSRPEFSPANGAAPRGAMQELQGEEGLHKGQASCPCWQVQEGPSSALVRASPVPVPVTLSKTSSALLKRPNSSFFSFSPWSCGVMVYTLGFKCSSLNSNLRTNPVFWTKIVKKTGLELVLTTPFYCLSSPRAFCQGQEHVWIQRWTYGLTHRSWRE